MDFGTLLSVAQKNEGNVKQPIACYQTKFTPPKKQTKQTKALSENIKKFLARKEEEERQKALEEKKKKENLLALRDHKAQSRINKHLKVCKAANKSVLADAIDNENTAVTMAGPSQPDEDDYGYVSQEASAFYNQLMSKYNTSASQKPMYSSGKRTVKDIASTKDRVKQALKQQEIDEALGHRRKRKSSTKDTEGGDPISEKEPAEDNEKQKEEKEKPKKRKMAPPPIDFGELLKIAEKKQHETIVIEPKPKVEEPERLMTKKQMKEYAKEKEWREKRERERSGEPNKTPVQNKLKPIPKIPSANKTPTKSSNPKKPEELKRTSDTRKYEESKKTDDSRKQQQQQQPDEAKKPAERGGILRTALEKIPSKSNGKMPEKIVSKAKSEKDKILEERRKLEEEKRQVEEMRLALQEKMKKLEKAKKEEAAKPPERMKVKVEKKEVRKEAPKPSVSTMNGKPKQFPPPDLKPIRKPMKDMKRPVSNKRRIYDEDEEYDSELDDFIDDDVQEDGEDYSKYISEIFGYDKSKYRNVDEDDTAMESSFAQQLKEEYVSTKIGIMEDLEDIRMEALEKKRKAMLKKKLKK